MKKNKMIIIKKLQKKNKKIQKKKIDIIVQK